MNNDHKDYHANKVLKEFSQASSENMRSLISSIQGLVKIAKCYSNHKETNKCFDFIETCASKLDVLITDLEEVLVIVDDVNQT